jgi:hypothetical protein
MSLQSRARCLEHGGRAQSLTLDKPDEGATHESLFEHGATLVSHQEHTEDRQSTPRQSSTPELLAVPWEPGAGKAGLAGASGQAPRQQGVWTRGGLDQLQASRHGLRPNSLPSSLPGVAPWLQLSSGLSAAPERGGAPGARERQGTCLVGRLELVDWGWHVPVSLVQRLPCAAS